MEIYKTNMIVTISAVSSNNMLVKELERYHPGEGQALANALLAGSAQITSAEHGYELLTLAEVVLKDKEAKKFLSKEPFSPKNWEEQFSEDSVFRKKFKAFLNEYGHRPVYELDIIHPRWREDPTFLFSIIKNTMDIANITKMKKNQRQKSADAMAKVKSTIPFYRRMMVKYWLNQAIKSAELRELGKSTLVMLLEPIRHIFLEMGTRLKKRGIIEESQDVFHCSWPEIYAIFQKKWDGKGLALLIEERKKERKELQTISPPDVITNETPEYAHVAIQSSDKFLTGIGVAAGKSRGTAKVVQHPDEGEKLAAGDVLVAPSTDPAWTPLFLRAVGVVMETGGYLSHGSIVAREYGARI